MSTKKKSVEITGEDDLDGLRTDKQVAFSREYPKDFNATAAAIRAGYSEQTAYSIGSELLKKPEIRAAIARRMAAAADAAEVSAEMVISELYSVATADSRELTSVHRGACRFCWGLNGDRMWSHGEYLDAYYKAQADKPNAPAPPIRGGTSYDFTREPNPECMTCRGLGEERVIVQDTRTLSRAAAKLIVGVKQTKDGIELKTNDRMAALIALGKVRGIFVERQEHSGPNGAPLQLQPVHPPREPKTLTDDELRDALRAAGHPLLLDGGNK